jgi:hypothetical protein
MAKEKDKEPVSLYSKDPEFIADEVKLAELKQSITIEDQLTVLLMEYNEEESGLWYSFARPKAQAILQRFNVTEKDHSGQP